LAPTASQLVQQAKRVKPLTDEHLWGYIAAFCGVEVPRARITLRPGCRNHVAPFEYLADSFFDRVGDCIVWANRGGSKTFCAALLSVLEHVHKPALQTRILGGSLEQSKRMYEHFEPFAREQFAEFVDGEPQQLLTRFRNGGKVEILAASMRSVLGRHIPRLRLDEVDEFDPEVLSAAMGTSMDVVVKGKVVYRSRVEELSTFHHPYGVMATEIARTAETGTRQYRWCLFETLERCSTDYSCSQCNLWGDCQGVAKQECAGYITVDNAQKWKRRHSIEAWESWFLCKRPYAGSSFFRSYDPELHVARAVIPYNPDLPLYRTWDWGTNGPTACLWIQVDEHGPRLQVLVIDEMRCDHTASSDMVRQFQRHHAEMKYGPVIADYCDPSGLSYILEWQKAGIYPVGRGTAKQGARALNMRMEGWEIIRQLLRDGEGKPSLVISPACRFLPDEFAEAHYPEQKVNQPPSEDMVEVNDHSLAALRYFCLGVYPQMPWRFKHVHNAMAGRPRRRT
jgi:hypothetical protein